MDKLSREDHLELQNMNLRKQLLEIEERSLVAKMKERYKLEDGDTVDASGSIIRVKQETKSEG